MNNAVKLIAGSIIALSATSALADSGKWYAGGGIGLSRYHDWATKQEISDLMFAYGATQGVDRFVGSENPKADNGATGYKLFGGYSIDKNFGLELSYVDLGKVDGYSRATGTFYDVANSSVTGDLYMKAQADVSAFILDLNWNVPLVSGASLLLQGGAYRADSKIKLQGGGSITMEDYYYSKSENSTGLHLGVGVDVKVAQSLGIRAEWESLQDVKANDGKSDIGLLSASVIYTF